MSSVLRGRDLYRFFHDGDDEVIALRGVDVSLARGEIVAVTGPSGSGKSTLLACLAGLDEPDGGTVSVAGERISRRPETTRAALRARHIGVVHQNGNLLDDLTLDENMLLAQQLAGRADRETRAALRERVGLEGRDAHRPAQLSGGELVRAGLATALANRPAVLLADEPTGELDSRTAEEVIGLLREVAREGTAVMAMTHDRRLAEHADREVRLHDGAVVA